MSKGRRALPSNLHVLHGTERKDRHGGGLSVQIVCPEPPDGLPDVAAEEWRRQAPVLAKYRLLSDLDLTTLEIYCRVFSRWLDAERELEASGSLVFKTQTGYQTQSAYLNIINQCIKQMLQIMGEFGMTPATRERLKAIANQPEQQDLFGDFLSRKKDTAQNG